MIYKSVRFTKTCELHHLGTPMQRVPEFYAEFIKWRRRSQYFLAVKGIVCQVFYEFLMLRAFQGADSSAAMIESTW